MVRGTSVVDRSDCQGIRVVKTTTTTTTTKDKEQDPGRRIPTESFGPQHRWFGLREQITLFICRTTPSSPQQPQQQQQQHALLLSIQGSRCMIHDTGDKTTLGNGVAMWRRLWQRWSAFTTTLCVGTFTCAAELIDARLCISISSTSTNSSILVVS
ncbi:hypothetical protein M0802_006494 [Mischocyttarus mexicanus]|nr:hypothetical protein M0802_006494 [Mischocyttarus mexicanus]